MTHGYSKFGPSHMIVTMGASLALRLQAQACNISKEVAIVARWQGTPAYCLTILSRRQHWGWGGGGGVVAGASAAA